VVLQAAERTPYPTVLTVIGWAAAHQPWIAGRAASIGYTTTASFERLPFTAWYGLLENWFVEAHCSAFVPPHQVLDYLTNDAVREWERLRPRLDRHGRTERHQLAQARAEDLYGATPRA
jgi:hypothetical protein